MPRIQPMLIEQPHHPQPYPAANSHVRTVGHSYLTPAKDRRTHKRIPHLWFLCVVVSESGEQRCVLIHR
jgi:hypothetical protein